MATPNGHAYANGNGCHAKADASKLTDIFPEAHQTLADADPEIYGIVEQEKVRQW